MKRPTTYKEATRQHTSRATAMQRVATMVNDSGLRGIPESNLRMLDEIGKGTTEQTESLLISFERSPAIGCTLEIELRHSFDLPETFEATDLDGYTVKVYKSSLRSRIGWSGTSRTLAEAVASNKLYREVIELGAEIEAMASRWDIADLLVQGGKVDITVQPITAREIKVTALVDDVGVDSVVTTTKAQANDAVEALRQKWQAEVEAEVQRKIDRCELCA